MWITILVMGAVVSLEPFRIGVTVLMLNRPRPILQLLAFLCGGFAMGLTVGLVVLFVFGPGRLGSPHFTLPRIQIVIGMLALLIAAVLATRGSVSRLLGRWHLVEPVGGDTRSWGLSTPARRLLDGRSLWTAGAVGLGIALPSVDYLAVLAVIVASGAAAATQVAALLMFSAVAFALVEIPLVGYVVAPSWTRASMAALHDWISTRRRRDVAGLLAGVGCVLLAVGVASL